MSNRKWVDRLQTAIGGIILDNNNLITEKGVVTVTSTLQVTMMNLSKTNGSRSLGKFRLNDTEGSFASVVSNWNAVQYPYD